VTTTFLTVATFQLCVAITAVKFYSFMYKFCIFQCSG